MSRRGTVARRAGLAAGVLAVAAGGAFAPRALQETEAFRVERVEVTGTRFLDPLAVVRAAGLDGEASLFDDLDAWRGGIRTLALVDDVVVRRVFPTSVVVEVREVAPAVLLARPGRPLRPVDGSGRLLELEPAGAMLDLPILSGAEVRGATVAHGPSTAAIVTVNALLTRAPELAERLSQVEVVGETLRLSFRDTEVVAVIPAASTAPQITQLRLAFADLAARGELGKVRRIDVRFRDQVVVSFNDSGVS